MKGRLRTSIGGDAFLRLNQKRWALWSRLNVGRSYMLLGKLDLAETIFEQALGEITRTADPSARPDLLNNLGRCC